MLHIIYISYIQYWRKISQIVYVFKTSFFVKFRDVGIIISLTLLISLFISIRYFYNDNINIIQKLNTMNIIYIFNTNCILLLNIVFVIYLFNIGSFKVKMIHTTKEGSYIHLVQKFTKILSASIGVLCVTLLVWCILIEYEYESYYISVFDVKNYINHIIMITNIIFMLINLSSYKCHQLWNMLPKENNWNPKKKW